MRPTSVAAKNSMFSARPIAGREPSRPCAGGREASLCETVRLAYDHPITTEAAYATIDHVPDAVAAYRRAVELDGDIIEARVGYARALTRLGKLDDAAFQLLQAARVDPANARVAKELGIVLYDKRLYDKALIWL